MGTVEGRLHTYLEFVSIMIVTPCLFLTSFTIQPYTNESVRLRGMDMKSNMVKRWTEEKLQFDDLKTCLDIVIFMNGRDIGWKWNRSDLSAEVKVDICREAQLEVQYKFESQTVIQSMMVPARGGKECQAGGLLSGQGIIIVMVFIAVTGLIGLTMILLKCRRQRVPLPEERQNRYPVYVGWVWGGQE